METGATGAGGVSAFSSGVAAMSASHSRRVMGLLLSRCEIALSQMISQLLGDALDLVNRFGSSLTYASKTAPSRSRLGTEPRASASGPAYNQPLGFTSSVR